METLLRWVHHPRRSFSAWYAALSGPARIVLFATLAYAVVMAVLAAEKIVTERAYAWDLGTYSQSLYTTAFEGRFFYYTADLPNNPGGSMFGAHFTPFLFLFVPLYRLLPSPATLVVVQTVALALGAPLVFRIARRRLKEERMAATLALLYLLHPAVEGVNWFDFHPEAFMIVFLLGTILAWEARRWRWLVLFLALTLATLEMAGVLVAVLGAFWALDMYLGRRAWRPLLRTRDFQVAVGLVALGTAWAWIGVRLVILANPGNALLAGGSDFWKVLGASSVGGVPWAIVSNPGRLVSALAYDGLVKLWYLILLFAPLCFWPFRRPLALLLLVPWLAIALPSNASVYYVVGNQYPAFVAPFLFYAAILGLERRARKPAALASPAPARSFAQVASSVPGQPAVLVAVGVAFFLVAAPIGAVDAVAYGTLPIPNEHTGWVQEMAALVAPGASILTQNDLFVLFANRANAYVIPDTTYFGPGDSFNRTLRAYFNESLYVFVDLEASLPEAAVTLLALESFPGFGVLAAADGALLLEKGYTGPPVFFVPFTGSYDAQELEILNGTVVSDPATSSGLALASVAGYTGPFWSGPGVQLWPGHYLVTYRLRVNSSASGQVLQLVGRVHPRFAYVLPRTVSSQATAVVLSTGALGCVLNLTSDNLTKASFGGAAGYVSITLPITAASLGLYDFTGYLPVSNPPILLDRVSIVEVSPLGYLQAASCSG